jgi:hypothetical protein
MSSVRICLPAGLSFQPLGRSLPEFEIGAGICAASVAAQQQMDAKRMGQPYRIQRSEE